MAGTVAGMRRLSAENHLGFARRSDYLSYCHGTLQLAQYGRLYNQRSATTWGIIDQATARSTRQFESSTSTVFSSRPRVSLARCTTAAAAVIITALLRRNVESRRAEHFFSEQEKNSLTVFGLSTAEEIVVSILLSQFAEAPRINMNFRSRSRRRLR